ncbi:NfeD family protein [Sedimentitalea sp. HM32M-2]|uniref:NfeD family protein n=1 Tax=Sedimentitalea sp. HM32M-2 TaxID=3351566 RepID=UPI003643D680
MAFWSLWWVWLCAGLILAIVEVLVPGFIFLGFAIGAGVVALFLALGLAVSLPVLMLIFAALSLIAWLVLRRVFALPRGQVKRFKDDINE